MPRKSCENVDSKRELLYSFSTLVFTPLLYYFAVTSAFSSKSVGESTTSPPIPNEDKESSTVLLQQSQQNEEVTSATGSTNNTSDNDLIIKFILEQHELPFETVFYVVLFEIIKLLIVFTVFPATHLFDQSPSLSSMWNLSNLGSAGLIASSSSVTTGANSSKASLGRLPYSYSKRDRDSAPGKSPAFQVKVAELWKGLCNYVVGCVICHGLVVLLGAPIVEDCKLTFQFSVIVTTWLLSPMYLTVQPSRLLQELMFISLWSADNEVLQHSKWRFVTTVFGAWAGAVVIPLDWDRPWQKWPIPCLSSVTFAFLISNVVLTIHLFCSIFGIYLKLHMISTESNKIKNF